MRFYFILFHFVFLLFYSSQDALSDQEVVGRSSSTNSDVQKDPRLSDRSTVFAALRLFFPFALTVTHFYSLCAFYPGIISNIYIIII